MKYLICDEGWYIDSLNYAIRECSSLDEIKKISQDYKGCVAVECREVNDKVFGEILEETGNFFPL